MKAFAGFSIFALLFLWGTPTSLVGAFGISRLSSVVKQRSTGIILSNVISDIVDAIEDVEQNEEREMLKRQILQLGASYDRGFGASPRVRSKMEGILKSLGALNPEVNASRFIDGPEQTAEGGLQVSPLTGNWRMIWTTAADVLVLGGNPLVSVGAIYQFISPPTVTNVIDFMPRYQNLLPTSLVPNSMARAKVITKASSRRNKPNRIGLNFERVEFRGQELLGQDVSNLLPPLGVDLPRIELSEDVGYFDVTYLDQEILVIRQNDPGGCFVLVNVANDTEP